MPRRSDLLATARGPLGASLATAALTLGLLAASVGMLVPSTSWAQAPGALPAMPEDEGLDAASEHQSRGHPEEAARVLTRLAEAGQVVAMERLGLMHWYGELLYGSGPWRREIGAWWFERAAQDGSVLGRYMRAVVQRAGVVPSPVALSEGYPMP